MNYINFLITLTLLGKVVAPGRAFVWCLCNIMAGLQHSHHRNWVIRDMRHALAKRQEFLETYSAVSLWCNNLLFKANLQDMSDAAGLLQFGVTLGDTSVPKNGLRTGSRKIVSMTLYSLNFFPLWLLLRSGEWSLLTPW